MSLFTTSRRNFIKNTGLGLAGLPWFLQACASGKAGQKMAGSYFVYVGTYAKPEQDSIFGYRLNPATGELSSQLAFKGGENPSFLTLNAKKTHLYAVNEIGNFNNAKSGAVSSFAVDAKTGQLRLLNQQATEGASPCYVSLDKTEKVALVANYSGGNVLSYPVQENGSLRKAVSNEQHQGSSISNRQSGPHAHCILPDPKNNFIFAVDLGLDQVLGYRLDSKNGKLTRAAQPAFQTKPGAGPRHLTFHPNGKLAFLICELNSTMTALDYNEAQGTFTEIQTLSTLPSDFTGESYCADVHVSPNGKFLYGSNRGHNSVVVYSINEATGQLTLVQHVSTQGNWPRNFAIDPSGRILLVANERSNDIFTFRIDPNTGQLTSTGFSAQVSKPVCLRIVSDFG
ncbi:lactonase family protein [Adhaeribacter pallidiroseus]|uniref:6-phosphogluconolactonase n=1 Tax=Adhaeribacter pallidiroseus TaxID=2072847 RepID=A0A369QL91_9BACT|nr:lactonase family protein [Adhaeribacter pallidiroseus]RDC63996.1 6-phosphogluconolactonase [Adhaeribacter pallidiroseus]